MLPTHISCAGFSLRPWQPDDRPALLRHANDAAVARNLRLLPHPYDAAAADAWLAEMAFDPPSGVWAVDVDGEAVGCIALERGTDIDAASYEIGYWLGQAHWGRGIATAAVHAVTAHAWTDPLVARVYAMVFSWNTASMRVLAKAGYTREAVLVRAGIKDGTIFDRVVYACTRATELPYLPFRAPEH